MTALRKKILRNLQPGEVHDPIPAPASTSTSTSRMRAKLRAIGRREDVSRGSGDARWALLGLDASTTAKLAALDNDPRSLDERLAALGLADVSEEHGRPEWHAPRGRIETSAEPDVDGWDEWSLALDRAEQADVERETLDELHRKRGLTGVTPARLRELEAAAAERDRLPFEQKYLPDPIPRAPLGEMKIQRNAVGQIAAMGNGNVMLRVVERREGKTMAVSVEGPGVEPYRLKVRRDAAGRLLGVCVEDR